MTSEKNDPIRVLVVDDSAVARGTWTRILEAENDMKVVGTAINGRRAIDFLKSNPADVIILDIEMPEMDGISAIPHLLSTASAARIIVASTLTTQGSKMAVKALSMGASDYIAKPTTLSSAGGLKEVSVELVLKTRALGKKNKDLQAQVPHSILAEKKTQKHFRPEVLCIGSSTGGPNALSVVLKGLSLRFQLPILVVQHMPAYFTTVLAESLAKDTGRDCREAVHGEILKESRIYLAPGDFHMKVEKDHDLTRICLTRESPEHFCRPAVDPLFRSVASVYREKVLAVVLTGLGEDGRGGAEEIVKNNGRVIVQDEATSIVWGMPGAVARAGLASAILPLSEVSRHVEGSCFETPDEGELNVESK